MNVDRTVVALAGVVVVAVLSVVTIVSPLGPRDPLPAGLAVVRGDPDAGRATLAALGCSGCHVIAGVRVPGGQVGPPLSDLGSRRYVVGNLPNTPDNLVRFIVDPRGVRPDTLMPHLGVTEDDAWDMVAYLATLGGRP